MANRLAGAVSPYLRQHADNPVDWWPWEPAAFEAAAARDVPVLLSVGYAACHWCHVMARESFEDGPTALLMNENFVSVKVDREERPDVDAAYMRAVTGLTGSGGWPMTVFCTPDGRPFHAGTYFPPEPRHGMPSFRQVLAAVDATWRQRRAEVEHTATRIADALAGGGAVPTAGGLATAGPDGLDGPDPAQAVARLAAAADPVHGGFGSAPKFPPSCVLLFLLRHGAGTGASAETARDLADATLAAMARSGMYDQLAGGFARYAVDRAWVVPHFEKMLYDNALLARAYLHWWRLTGEPAGARIALETCDWIVRELGTPDGGLASSLDADTPVHHEPEVAAAADPADLARTLPRGGHGVEGLTYVWTPQLLATVLGEEDGAWAAQLLGVDPGGSFHAGASTLRLLRDPWGTDEEGRWRDVRDRLLRARLSRPQPERDDKVVAAWNGLAVAALAETGALLARPDLVRAAQATARLLARVHLTRGPDGTRLARVSRDGRAAEAPAVLEDYGDVAEGLLTLAGVDGDPQWVDIATELLDVVAADFADDDGVLHDVAGSGADEVLAALGRLRDPSDNAVPAGGSAAAGALLHSAALTGRQDHLRLARAALAGVAGLMAAEPRFTGWWWAVAEAERAGPAEIAVVGRPGERDRLHRVALAATSPGAVVAVGEPGAAAPALLSGRAEVSGSPAAYVCRGFVCLAPVTGAEELARSVGARSGDR